MRAEETNELGQKRRSCAKEKVETRKDVKRKQKTAWTVAMEDVRSEDHEKSER